MYGQYLYINLNMYELTMYYQLMIDTCLATNQTHYICLMEVEEPLAST
jgi:hypothetical protein